MWMNYSNTLEALHTWNENWINKSNDEIIEILQTPFLERDKQYTHIPVKKIQPNRAPAVAPIGVLEQNDGWNKIKIKLNDVENNIKILKQNPDSFVL